MVFMRKIFYINLIYFKVDSRIASISQGLRSIGSVRPALHPSRAPGASLTASQQQRFIYLDAA
jgi:hypothetical protein